MSANSLAKKVIHDYQDIEFVRLPNKRIKSPLNYIGGKQKLLEQILPLFPNNINTFVDLFSGGCNVGINVTANNILFNDNLSFLVEMYKEFQSRNLNKIIEHIEQRINKFNLSLVNEAGYKELRQYYNDNKEPLDLFVLVAYSFNHQIRFNNNHQFNNPFGKERSNFNAVMKQNLLNFVGKLQEINCEFSCHCFEDFNFSNLTNNDLVYCDPPYLITTGTYNDGKRGFKGWSEKEEKSLLQTLDKLNERNVRFALSNVLEHKGKSNILLTEWLGNNPDYNINYLDMNYSNSNYQTLDRNKHATVEVLITNYKPLRKRQATLFDKL